MGLTESPATGDDRQSDTKNKVNELLKEIGIENNAVKDTLRFDAKPCSSYLSLIKLILHKSIDRFTILKNSKKLRTTDNSSKIFYNLELTPAQRATQKLIIANKKAENVKLDKDPTSNRMYVIRDEQLVLVTKRPKPNIQQPINPIPQHN